jgi:hypothetical protein
VITAEREKENVSPSETLSGEFLLRTIERAAAAE